MVPFYIKFIKRILKALTSKKKLDWSDSSNLALRPLEHSQSEQTVAKQTGSLISQRIGGCFCQSFKEQKAYIRGANFNKQNLPAFEFSVGNSPDKAGK